MQTVDLRVVDLFEGKGTFKGTLGGVVVNFKGSQVGVGSGFSNDQRNDFWQHPEKIFGKIVEVQYFEESKDKTGKPSLRFPVFKQVRNDKNEESLF